MLPPSNVIKARQFQPTLSFRCLRCYLTLFGFRPIPSHFRPPLRSHSTLVIIRVKVLALKHSLPFRKCYVPRWYAGSGRRGQVTCSLCPDRTSLQRTRNRQPVPEYSRRINWWFGNRKTKTNYYINNQFRPHQQRLRSCVLRLYLFPLRLHPPSLLFRPHFSLRIILIIIEVTALNIKHTPVTPHSCKYPMPRWYGSSGRQRPLCLLGSFCIVRTMLYKQARKCTGWTREVNPATNKSRIHEMIRSLL